MWSTSSVLTLSSVTILIALLVAAIVVIILQPNWLPDFLTFADPNPDPPPLNLQAAAVVEGDAQSAATSAAPPLPDGPKFFEPGYNAEPSSEEEGSDVAEVRKMTIRPEMDMMSDRVNTTPSRLTGETSGVIRLFRSQMSGQLGETLTAQQEREHRGRENGNGIIFEERGGGALPSISEEEQ